MSEWFHVGQEVECIDDAGYHKPERVPTTPKRGDICTVRGFSRSIFGEWLLLEEHCTDAKFPITNEEVGYSFHRFRPLRKRTTSIEVFKALLNPNKEPVEA